MVLSRQMERRTCVLVPINNRMVQVCLGFSQTMNPDENPFYDTCSSFGSEEKHRVGHQIEIYTQ